MEQKFDFDVQVKLKSKKRRKVWQRTLSIMMCLVVFCTTYMLILPAITKENKTFCGIDEHTHNEKCFEKVLLCESHIHTENCYDSLSGLICTEPTDDGHTHGESCGPITESILVCDTEETEGHIHTESCAPAEEKILSCSLEETEGHTHTESCTVTETVLLDPTEEHTHSDECYTTVTSIVCGMEESAGHTHGDECYTVTITNGCGLEETEGHKHSDDCYETVTTYSCGLEETAPSHIHTEDCYGVTQQLICTVDVDSEHIHTDTCYEEKLICELKEHKHTQICFSDPSADLESAAVWEATLPKDLSGIYSEDVLKIAESQLGYTESSRNYIVDENDNIKGYTRYGDWYGVPYGDWCAMFTSFCIHYAGAEEIPLEASCSNWVKKLQEQDIYKTPSEYVPQASDIVFFDWDADGMPDHVGLVKDVAGTDVRTIEGNSGEGAGCVAQYKYELHDARIIGYGTFSELYFEQREIPVTDIDPEDTAAMAVLVNPNGEILEVLPSESEEPPALASTFKFGEIFTHYQKMLKTTGPLDLKDYINDITMYDEHENVIPNGSTVTEGDIIEFRIDFTLLSQQFGVMNENAPATVYTDTLVFDLPENIKVVQGVSDDIINTAGQTVGKFVIDDADGRITMKFDKTYVDQNIAGMQIKGYISFFSMVTKITDQDDERQEYPFKEGFTLGIVIKEKIEAVGDLRIAKQKAEVVGDEIVYELRVTSTEGTTGDITIKDSMSRGLTFKEGIEVLKGDGTAVNADFVPADDKSSFTMTLPEMAAGDSYVIRYRCTADVDLLGVDMTVRNTASVTGKDSQDNELKHDVTVDHTFELLKKTGVNNGDGTITWTITVNSAKADISGWTLEDIVSTATESVPYTGTVTIRDSNGNLVQENTTLPYVFPDGSKDTYIITYTTSHDLGDGDMIYNRAVLKDEDTDITVVTGTGIGQPIEKTGQAGTLIQDKNGKYILPITWTVNLNTQIGAIPAGEILIDKMGNGSANVVYMTYDQLITALSSMKEAIEAAGGQTGLIEASVYVPGEELGATYTFEELTANADSYRSLLFEKFAVTIAKEIPKGQVVSFSYDAYGEFDNNLVKDTSFENHFNISDHYDFNGRVDFSAGVIEATKMAMKPYNPNGGVQDWRLEWSGIEGTSKVNYDALFDSYLAWAIQLDVPSNYIGNGNVVIYEDLPEGVTVKGLDLPFTNTNNVPTSRKEIRNLLPGQTYTWDFKVYPIDQYDEYYEPNRTGAQDVSIVIKVTDSGDLEITVPGVVFELMAAYAKKTNQSQAQTYLFIYTQIDKDFDWPKNPNTPFVYVNTFENRFTIENEDGRIIDIGSQAQEVKMDERSEIIRKTATTTNNNIIEYSVVLNSKNKDLVKNSATLRVRDELTYTETGESPLRLRLVPGSVKLYEISMNADGTYTKGKEVKINYSYNENSTKQYGITTWTHTIDLNVPDSKSLVLEYNYRATGVKDVPFNIRNTCTLEGLGEGSLDGKHDVEIIVKNTQAQADTSGVMLFKVDASSDGVFLPKAKFNIYIWNEDAGPDGNGDYIIVNHPTDFTLGENMNRSDFVTNQSGMIVIDGSTIEEEQFAYNTAYYIVEKESPEGYYLSPEPYYFMIVHPDLVSYPPCKPDNFAGDELTRGDIIYRKNVSGATEISVEKYWQNYNGESIKVTKSEVPSVTLELWQKLEGDPNSAKLYDTYTIIPDEKGNWNLTITDLPKATEVKFDPDDPDNTCVTKGTNYLYYIKEVDVNGFTLESTVNNDGINSGIIKIVNRETEGYEIPETGGIGTNLYTVGGLLLIATAAILLLYKHLLRRREDPSSS